MYLLFLEYHRERSLDLSYINDLPDAVKHSNVQLFADDCVLYKQINSINDAHKVAIRFRLYLYLNSHWNNLPEIIISYSLIII